MATREVSTWAELRSAITSAASGDTIKLIADIDCNDEIPEGVSSTISPPTNISTLTITGEYTEDNVTKSHVIRNLRTSMLSPVTIFKFTADNTKYIYIRRIDFLNLILSAPLIEHYNSNNNSAFLYVLNCRITGKRTSKVINVTRTATNLWTTLDVRKSYFNIPYYGTAVDNLPMFNLYSAGSNVGGVMSNCRIRETFTGTYTPSSTDGEATCSVFNMQLSGCRVEGEVVSGKYPRYHSDAKMSGYTPAEQNVYDVDFKLTNNTDTSVPLYVFKGVVKIPIRKKDAETTTYTISSASTGVILADESQMQDVDWLIQHNFDIVPSNQG